MTLNILKKQKRMWPLFLIIAFVLFGFVAYYKGLLNFFIVQSKTKQVRVEWIGMGPTPEGEKKYTPQGLTWVNGHLIFANSWKNTQSRVYKFDPNTMQVLAIFDMPKEAVHTSGLAWDGRYLWAVDYIANRAYKIEIEKSFETGKVEVLGSFDTILKHTSACCVVDYKGEKLLCISDYMRSKKNILVRQEDALKQGTAKGNIVYSYRNEGFSQGLVFDGRYVYESENKKGVDVINLYDIEEAISKGSSRTATIVQYNAPAKGVEDLAWDGEYFWTSDETTFRFYKVKFSDAEH